MAHRVATNNLIKTWLNDASTYPLFVAMGGGTALVAFYLGRLAFQHPDTKAFHEQRKSAIQQNHQKGADYHSHDIRVAAVEMSRKPETREIFGSMNKAAIESRLKQY